MTEALSLETENFQPTKCDVWYDMRAVWPSPRAYLDHSGRPNRPVRQLCANTLPCHPAPGCLWRIDTMASFRSNVTLHYILIAWLARAQFYVLECLNVADFKGVRIRIELSVGTVSFLKCCEAGSIQLKNCPGYIREWIAIA
jgi:hypothetical protein